MSHCYKIGFPPKSCSHLIEIHRNTSPYTMHNWNIYGRWSITHKLALNALECLKMLCFTTMSHCYIFSFRAHVFQIYSQNPFYIPQWLWWWCAKVFRWHCDMMYSYVFRCIQMYSVIRINNVIKLGSGIRVIADCRLTPALLDQNWFVERVIWKVLLLHNKILINQDFMYLEGAHQGTQFSNAPPDLISLVLFMNRDVIGQVCPFFEESGNIIGTVDCQNLLVAMNVQRDCLK